MYLMPEDRPYAPQYVSCVNGTDTVFVADG